MKNCCKKTYQLAIEQVLFTIRDSSKTESVDEVIAGLEYAVKLMREGDTWHDA